MISLEYILFIGICQYTESQMSASWKEITVATRMTMPMVHGVIQVILMSPGIIALSQNVSTLQTEEEITNKLLQAA